LYYSGKKKTVAQNNSNVAIDSNPVSLFRYLKTIILYGRVLYGMAWVHGN